MCVSISFLPFSFSSCLSLSVVHFCRACISRLNAYRLHYLPMYSKSVNGTKPTFGNGCGGNFLSSERYSMCARALDIISMPVEELEEV